MLRYLRSFWSQQSSEFDKAERSAQRRLLFLCLLGGFAGLVVVAVIQERARTLFRVVDVDGSALLLDNGECITMAGVRTEDPARLEAALRARTQGRLVRFMRAEAPARTPSLLEGRLRFATYRFSENAWSGACAELFSDARGEPLRDERGCVVGVIAFEHGSAGYVYLSELREGNGWLDPWLAACDYLDSWTEQYSERSYRVMKEVRNHPRYPFVIWPQ